MDNKVTEREGEIECLENRVGTTVRMGIRIMENEGQGTKYFQTRRDQKKKGSQTCVSFAGDANYNHALHSLNQIASRRLWSGSSGHALVIYLAKHDMMI